MRNHNKLVVFFLLFILTLTGCSKVETKNYNIENLDNEMTKTNYIGHVQKETKLAPFEPMYGAYLGAYVLSNPGLEFNIKRFDEVIDREVAIAVRHYTLGEEIPINWLLECIAYQKTPYLIVLPPKDNIYNVETLTSVISNLAKAYSVPMFIELYPEPKKHGNPNEYVIFFQNAKEIINEIAPHITLVWGIDIEDVYDSKLYYPGENYVDWIGVSMYFSIFKGGELSNPKWEEMLDYLYKTYSPTKPIIISKLGVSHYSSVDHSFYIEEANKQIKDIYLKLPLKYPRIKGVNYMDINNMHIAPDGSGTDNFKISSELTITSKYKEIIKDPYYLSILDKGDYSSYQWIRLDNDFYKYQNKIYVRTTTPLVQNYYELDNITAKLGFKYQIDNNTIKIYK